VAYNYEQFGLEDVARETDLDALARRETILPVRWGGERSFLGHLGYLLRRIPLRGRYLSK
jgi:hypothetical protein